MYTYYRYLINYTREESFAQVRAKYVRPGWFSIYLWFLKFVVEWWYVPSICLSVWGVDITWGLTNGSSRICGYTFLISKLNHVSDCCMKYPLSILSEIDLSYRMQSYLFEWDHISGDFWCFRKTHLYHFCVSAHHSQFCKSEYISV